MTTTPNAYPLPIFEGFIPRLTIEQMIEVDRLMIETYRIELIQMMENAGRGLALLAKTRFLQEATAQSPIVVLAGTGGNGGGALVCARRLATWGYNVLVVVTAPEKMTPVPDQQLTILRNMEVPIHTVNDLATFSDPELVIDGIIGYSLSGNPFGTARTMIEWANEQPAPTLSLDTPSGIDLTSGTIFEPAMRAQATLTLALPKEGLFNQQVIPLRGELYLADISVPPALYRHPGLEIELPTIFRNSDILRID